MSTVIRRIATAGLVHIPSGLVSIEGSLELPVQPAGVILFAHGSGSSRRSPRNNRVAAQLREAGLGTLLIDLLTEEEDRQQETRFDIALLTDRLTDALTWLGADPRTAGLPVGLFGASTGAAAALQVAARHPETVAAVVSRGGRPDLAGRAVLRAVHAPVLLIVGGNDDIVIELNREALAELRGPRRISIVPRATHLFEEPGALEQVARLASLWFITHLEGQPASPPRRPAR